MSSYHGWTHRAIEAGGVDPPTGPWRTPTLLNGWAQPSAPLEPFAIRQGQTLVDFKGHLDASGASSGTVALELPSNLTPQNDVYWHTVITEDDGVTFSIALVFIDASTSEVTITWPAT